MGQEHRPELVLYLLFHFLQVFWIEFGTASTSARCFVLLFFLQRYEFFWGAE